MGKEKEKLYYFVFCGTERLPKDIKGIRVDDDAMMQIKFNSKLGKLLQKYAKELG